MYRTHPSPISLLNLGKTPKSAAIPTSISFKLKNAFSTQNLISVDTIRSRPPPIQPPYIPTITGIPQFSTIEMLSYHFYII